MLSFFECLVCVCVCVFCLFTPFLSALFVFHRKSLVLQHLIKRYDFCKLYWPLSVLCVFIYVRACVRACMRACVHACMRVCVCVCVCVCVISNHSTSKKPHVSDLSKRGTLLHKTRIKILRLNMCTSMTSLGKITHQMWYNHPFSQRNKTTEWAIGMGAGGDREGWGGQSLKKGGLVI